VIPKGLYDGLALYIEFPNMADFPTNEPLLPTADEDNGQFSKDQVSRIFAEDTLTDFYSRNDYRISPPIDQLYRPNYDLDTKWRSVAVAHQLPKQHNINHFQFSDNNSHISKHSDPEQQDSKGIAVTAEAVGTSSSSKKTSPCSSTSHSHPMGDFKAPEQPVLLMQTHFDTCVPISCIVANVERALLHFPEVSFEMVADDCRVGDIPSRQVVSHSERCHTWNTHG
jgi:hypothetical protein